MTLTRVRELMTIEQECIKKANTCGRDCAKCDLVQEDEELLAAYDIVQTSLVIMEHFYNAVYDLDEMREKDRQLAESMDTALDDTWEEQQDANH